MVESPKRVDKKRESGEVYFLKQLAELEELNSIKKAPCLK